MLETLPQILLFLIFIAFGIGGGVVIGLCNSITIFFRSRNWIRIITDILACLILCILFLIAINLFNWGEIRLYLALGYLLGIFIERKTLGKLFAKLTYKVYNWCIIKLKYVSSSKIGTILKR